ncbi:hypothetical protein KCU81_g3978, partial [Aureobasidium melanogenum]|uniref:Knr4/Smi1-like domain-containing protein n=1 Tax=Aureobasidium melanogenum (strain CBS 110374) TaxID=1043003 RepID=A0A074VT81_AURM1
MTLPSNLFVEPAYILTIPHISAVEFCILGLAFRFALLGRVDAARDFTELYYSRPALENLNLRALVVYWRMTEFPTGIPEDFTTDAFFEDYIKSYGYEDLRWPADVKPHQRTEDEAGLNAILSSDQGSKYRMSPAIIPALEMTVKLAEERNVDPLTDPKINEILATFPKRSFSTLEESSLVGSPRCARVFMSGALARIWGLSDQELDSRAAELLEASRQRYWYGPSSRGPETISELLQSCNNDTIARSDLHWQELGEEKPTTLYRSPASDEQISNLEQRLNVTLPEDFKAFLRISNGFRLETTDFGGIWNGYFPGPYLRSVDEIDWIDCRQCKLGFYQLTLPGLLKDYRDSTQADGEKLPNTPIFTDVVCIANEDIYRIWLIPPRLMQQMRDHYKQLYEMVNDAGKRIIERAIDDFAGSRDEWEKLDWGCWASGGEISEDSFKSFKAWLENAAWNAKNAGRDYGEEE